MPLPICWIGSADCLPDWDGISAIATACATAVALFLPGHQRKKERESKLRAARSALLPALNTICDYADDIGNDLRAAWPKSDASSIETESVDNQHLYVIDDFNVPPFPSAAAIALERIIEQSDDERLCDRAASILREAQILEARVAKRAIEMSRLSLLEYIEQVVSIRCRAETLLPFARGNSASCTADLWGQVESTLSAMPSLRELNHINYHLDQIRMINGPLGRGEQIF